jgi:GntR family transcriptional regulator, transcriptional repressor for pyruvate dehydrogenase complex
VDDSTARRPGTRLGLSPRIAESIAADLRQRILRGEEAEAPLPRQEDLIRQYGVSGPSLREALRILEAEGLITVRRGKFGGAYVHKPSWSSAAFAMALSLQGQGVTLGDLAASLLILEPMCAAACAERADRAETIVPAMRANLEQTERVVGSGEEYSASARTFHDLMVSGAPNPTMRLLVRTLVAIWSIQEETWAATVNAVQQYPSETAQRESLHAHQVLLQHIEDGDAEGASRYAAKHLRATQAIVLERFSGEIVDSSSLAAVQAFKSL